MTLRISAIQQQTAMFDGLAEAVGRHTERCSTGLRPTYITLAEALYWVGTIDEQLRDVELYRKLLAARPDGGLLPGLRYARNFATHQLIALSESWFAEDPPKSPTEGIVLEAPVWVGFGELPAPLKRTKHTPAQQDAYRRGLAGRSTVETLGSVARTFAEVRAAMDL